MVICYVVRNMSFDVNKVETVTVDSYGTLVDPSAVEGRLADHVDETESISTLWRSRSILYTMVSNYIDAYQPFYEMNRDALVYALEVHDVSLPADMIDEILSTYHELDVYEDVSDGLELITDAGFDVFFVSNGNPEMLTSMVEQAEIHSVITETISADEISTFKPSVDIYRHAAARTGTPIENIAHVAGPSFDVQGAMHAGMQGVWLDRTGSPWDGFAPDPDLRVESFDEIADRLVT